MMLSRCIHCFAQNACSVRFTKKGLPYTTCRICYTRCFFHSMGALRGVAVCPDLIDATLQQVAAGDPSARWVRDRTRTLNAYVRDKMTGKGLPEPTAEPVPYTDEAAQEKVA